MPRRLKCYVGNLDGLRRGLVLAHNQKRAAEIAGTSLYDFRRYWCGSVAPEGAEFEPETLYTRSYKHSEGVGKGKWEKGRVAYKGWVKWKTG
jgi:hypothetical protein